MCEHPGSGIKPKSPALAGGFFTSEPPGKPHIQFWPQNITKASKTGWVLCLRARTWEPEPPLCFVSWVGSSCPEEEHAGMDCITLLQWFHPLYLLLRKMASKWQHFSVWEQCQSCMTWLTGRNLTWFGLMESKHVLIPTGILQIFFLGSTVIALSRVKL